MASGKVRQRAAACENVFGDGVMRRKGSQETHALRRERVQSSGWEVRSRPPRHPCIVPPTVDQQYASEEYQKPMGLQMPLSIPCRRRVPVLGSRALLMCA